MKGKGLSLSQFLKEKKVSIEYVEVQKKRRGGGWGVER